MDEGEGAYGNYVICATNHFRILNGWYGSGMVADQFKNGIAHIRHNIRMGEISNGNYRLKVTSGNKIIRISAVSSDPKLVGPPPADMPPGGLNPPREYIPEHFNVQSRLSAEVAAKNNQVFDFDLEK